MKKSEICIPESGMDRESLLASLQNARKDDTVWQQGRAFCLVYHPGDERAALVKEAYNMFFSENALNPSAFPSLRRFESEVVKMAADLFNGDADVEGTMLAPRLSPAARGCVPSPTRPAPGRDRSPPPSASCPAVPT